MNLENKDKEAIDAIAERIVSDFFLKLGVDVEDKDAMHKLRDNLIFLGRMADGAREIKSVVIKTGVGAAVTGFITLVVIGLRDWLTRAPH